VFIEVFSLELHNVPDQQFSILTGHPDEAAMEAIRVVWVGDKVNTQHFEVGLKEHLARKEQGAKENLIDREDLIECDTDAAAADVDGPLDERSLRLVALKLETDGQGDGDAIKLAAICRRRFRSRRIWWHGAEEYSKKQNDLERSMIGKAYARPFDFCKSRRSYGAERTSVTEIDAADGIRKIMFLDKSG